MDQVKTSLTAIKGDFQKIVDAQPKLNDKRKSDLKDANDAFQTGLQNMVAGVSLSSSPAKLEAQLRTQLTQLFDAYSKALSQVSC